MASCQRPCHWRSAFRFVFWSWALVVVEIEALQRATFGNLRVLAGHPHQPNKSNPNRDRRKWQRRTHRTTTCYRQNPPRAGTILYNTDHNEEYDMNEDHSPASCMSRRSFAASVTANTATALLFPPRSMADDSVEEMDETTEVEDIDVDSDDAEENGDDAAVDVVEYVIKDFTVSLPENWKVLESFDDEATAPPHPTLFSALDPSSGSFITVVQEEACGLDDFARSRDSGNNKKNDNDIGNTKVCDFVQPGETDPPLFSTETYARDATRLLIRHDDRLKQNEAAVGGSSISKLASTNLIASGTSFAKGMLDPSLKTFAEFETRSAVLELEAATTTLSLSQAEPIEQRVLAKAVATTTTITRTTTTDDNDKNDEKEGNDPDNDNDTDENENENEDEDEQKESESTTEEEDTSNSPPTKEVDSPTMSATDSNTSGTSPDQTTSVGSATESSEAQLPDPTTPEETQPPEPIDGTNVVPAETTSVDNLTPEAAPPPPSEPETANLPPIPESEEGIDATPAEMPALSDAEPTLEADMTPIDMQGAERRTEVVASSNGGELDTNTDPLDIPNTDLALDTSKSVMSALLALVVPDTPNNDLGEPLTEIPTTDQPEVASVEPLLAATTPSPTVAIEQDVTENKDSVEPEDSESEASPAIASRETTDTTEAIPDPTTREETPTSGNPNPGKAALPSPQPPTSSDVSSEEADDGLTTITDTITSTTVVSIWLTAPVDSWETPATGNRLLEIWESVTYNKNSSSKSGKRVGNVETNDEDDETLNAQLLLMNR